MYRLITIVGGFETAFTLTTAARLPVPAIAPATATAASATIPDPIRSLRTFNWILSGRPSRPVFTQAEGSRPAREDSANRRRLQLDRLPEP